RLGVLGRGVDGGRFDPARRSAKLRASWGVADGDLVVLYVGRLAPEKNVELAVEAYRAMQRACGGALRFVVVGDGPLGDAPARARRDGGRRLVACGRALRAAPAGGCRSRGGRTCRTTCSGWFWACASPSPP